MTLTGLDELARAAEHVLENIPELRGAGHTISLTFESNKIVTRLICHEPTSATCRQGCAKGCEAGDACTHSITETEECTAAHWMKDNIEEYCDYMEPFPLYDGMPVRVDWDSDTWVWEPLHK